MKKHQITKAGKKLGVLMETVFTQTVRETVHCTLTMNLPRTTGHEANLEHDVLILRAASKKHLNGVWSCRNVEGQLCRLAQ